MFDFRHYINLITEAQYDSLADAIRRQFSDQLELINSNIQWSKTALKKADRITWYLKILRLYLEDNLTPEVLGDYQFSTLEQLQNDLVHYYGFNDAAIEAYQYRNQSIGNLIRDLQQLEKKWREKQNQERGVDPRSGDYVLFEFADGVKWWFINRAYCSEEGRSGRHCGNIMGQTKTDQRILSLRDNRNRVILTFIREPDGTLGEMKAKGNQKPDSRYHPHIIKLLLWDEITGITGKGYLPDMNFSVFDLNEEQINYLDQHKSKLIVDQINATPFDLLTAPDSIKQKYRAVALKQEPLIGKVLFDSSLDNWINLIEKNKKLIIYLPIEYYNSFPDFEYKLLQLLSDNPELLLKLPKKISKNTNFLEKLVNINPYSIEYIPPTIKNYRKLCIIGLSQDGDVIADLNPDYVDESMIKLAIDRLIDLDVLGSPAFQKFKHNKEIIDYLYSHVYESNHKYLPYYLKLT